MLEANGLASWFKEEQQKTENWYLASSNPYQQSGWGSTPARWRCVREVILTAVNKNGSFLDVGCANGLLLESLIQWASEQKIQLIPYGIDISSRLIELACQRLPDFTNNFAIANALYWRSTTQYDFIHTLLEYVPSQLHSDYIQQLFNTVKQGGRLIISSYSNRSRQQQTFDVVQYLKQLGYPVAGNASTQEEDGWILTRVAWIEKR
ncbi:class I SAM-dependent methyltransferase [Chroococcidiopsis thermalis]|uniref:Methyltransferase type 12 n=1 Tax=Chroococcidiopsis thermalis (strain PCC 7203) TaxID=251229 RepID=K9U2R1_CHRTP|nr:methyltransferase domain-containing protein [Chroococcidiopsis thermalis]AFY88529.1 hypothetical protein Chro_3062 [Chroococcidiopsis thermalis PCC 7203]